MSIASSSLRTASLLFAIAGFGGIGLFQGCVISYGEVDCTECDSSALCHNHVGEGGACFCDAGYTDPDPTDEDLECEPVDSRAAGSMCVNPGNVMIGSSCTCAEGYTWCNNTDFTCCEDPSQDSLTGGVTTWDDESDSGGDTTTGGPTTSGTTTGTGTTTSTTGTTTGPMLEPPDDAYCTAEAEGARACSNSDPMNVAGTMLWQCESGAWVERPDIIDSFCVENYFGDFGFGCYNDYETNTVQIVCGQGPGTACTIADDACLSNTEIQYCQYGKLASADCTQICSDAGNEVTYTYGFCYDADGQVACDCCDYPENGACPPPSE